MRVFKYPIPILDEFTLALPDGANILAVQAPGDEPVLWALVEESAPPKTRSFILRGTGHVIAEQRAVSYCGTFQLHGGGFIGHVFEVLA